MNYTSNLEVHIKQKVPWFQGLPGLCERSEKEGLIFSVITVSPGEGGKGQSSSSDYFEKSP